MQRLFPEKITRWLLPTVLILFILEVITLPLVLGITYSGRSETPDHVLTYTRATLTWDSATGIDENGTARLNLFDAEYDSAVSSDETFIVAPGTEGFNIVRLHNKRYGQVEYVAVLYRIRTNDALPVEPGLGDSENYVDTEEYVLPEEIENAQVIRAVHGKLNQDEIQDFDITWKWDYYSSEEQDLVDTTLGNENEADQVTVGLYIVVIDNIPEPFGPPITEEPEEEPVEPEDSAEPGEEPKEEDPVEDLEDVELPDTGEDESFDEEDIIKPQAPKTGDNSHLGMYLGLMAVSLIVLLLLLWDRRKEKKC